MQRIAWGKVKVCFCTFFLWRTKNTAPDEKIEICLGYKPVQMGPTFGDPSHGYDDGYAIKMLTEISTLSWFG